MSLSVVIPAYNSAAWLPSTLDALDLALAGSTWRSEVIVVDDGSTDSTAVVLEGLKANLRVPLTVVHQENKGRFLARWEGLLSAHGRYLLLLDSRVLLREDAIARVQEEIEANPTLSSWNAHVETDPEVGLVGRFWEVPTYVFWGSYLADPRPMLITPANFDRVPKGTTCFLTPSQLFKRACLGSWPHGDAHLTSDDTKLLRFIVNETPIRLDPGFSATYRPRSDFLSFISHARTRGTLFVDSYAGTSELRNIVLVLLAVLPPTVVLVLGALVAVGSWGWVASLLVLVVALLLTPAVVASTRRCPSKAILSYLAFIVPFGAVFWIGLVRGVLIHRASFSRKPPQIGKAES